jgi:type III secretion protein J
LRAAEVPTHPTPGWAEVFGSSGLLPTTTEERARYGAALSGELERSIEAMDGVIDARVHLALPETCTALLDGPRPKGRASVMIKQRQGVKLVDEAAIRALVAGAATELEAGEVTVVRVTGSVPPSVKPDWVRVGPLTVTRSSAPMLKAITTALFLLDIALAIALVALLVRFRRILARSALERGGTAANLPGRDRSL